MSSFRPLVTRHLLIVGTLTLLFGVGFPACAQHPMVQTEPGMQPKGERFYIKIPRGWTEAIRSRQQGADVVAYVPGTQSAARWADMLTVQVFRGMTALPIQAFFERTRSTYRKSCSAVRGGPLQSGVSNGYPSAFWILACGQNVQQGFGETTFFRVIQGDHALYILQRLWRTDPFDETTAPPISRAASQQAIDIMRRFGVCDPGLKAHPCPQREQP